MSNLASHSFIVKSATVNDAENIHKLFAPFVSQKIVLERSLSEISEIIGDFIVAIDSANNIIGCVSLYDYGSGLCEVRSLIVVKDYQHIRCGSALLKKSIELAKERGTRRLFALTLRESFFENNGFKIVSKELFPEKVWKDCHKCTKQDCCDEIAVMLELVD